MVGVAVLAVALTAGAGDTGFGGSPAAASLAGLSRFAVLPGAVPASPPAAVAYRLPVAAALRVVRGFDPPTTPFGPGHRGVDLALPQGGQVLAAAAGTVTFAGRVAGRGVVVIAHADGIRTEYEPVTPSMRRGAGVAAGTPVGAVSGTHAGCETSCLHWGARRGETYLDPLTLLRPLGPVRLLPWRR